MAATAPLYPSSFRARPPSHTPIRANRRTVSVPEGATPIVKLLFSEIARQRVGMEDLEWGSGVRKASIKAWKRKNRPGAESLQACFSFLGWDFLPVPCLEALPPDLAGDLVALARRGEMTIPEVWRAVLDVAVEQRVLAMDVAERRAIREAHHARIFNRKQANDNTPRKRTGEGATSAT